MISPVAHAEGSGMVVVKAMLTGLNLEIIVSLSVQHHLEQVRNQTASTTYL